MDFTKRRFWDIYINGSIHVAVAVCALVQMTFYFCGLPQDWAVSLMAFCGTIFSYNFIKYATIVRATFKRLPARLWIIVLLSLWAFVIGTACFFFLNIQAQLVTVALLVLSVFYAIPITKQIPNLRQWTGTKIYIVCLCWATVTLIVPLLNANMEIGWDIGIKFLQRFILVLLLIGVFEIVDLQYDDSSLKTLPQTLGVVKTKYLLSLLLIPFYVLEFFKVGFEPVQAWNNLILVLLVAFFIWYASPKRTKFYTLFWVESVPIVWWGLILIEKYL